MAQYICKLYLPLFANVNIYHPLCLIFYITYYSVQIWRSMEVCVVIKNCVILHTVKKLKCVFTTMVIFFYLCMPKGCHTLYRWDSITIILRLVQLLRYIKWTRLYNSLWDMGKNSRFSFVCTKKRINYIYTYTSYKSYHVKFISHKLLYSTDDKLMKPF